LLLPQLAQMKELSQNLAELAKSYRQAGDESSAQAALQIAANLGQRYSIVSPGEPEISQLVGIAMERIALNGMDANSPYGSDGRTVKDRLDQLDQQKAELRQLAQQTEALLPKMTEQDWISYKDRWRNFGEQAAGRWLINKYGQ
jgi:multidrug efflux pump subunit AcrA (membrane-fusion protein)